ncbi:MAG: hypothetical protein J2P21_03740 [Chloracidobacterium sp.]|nr:hypothetical protein [Chloracidobacterium sp.]
MIQLRRCFLVMLIFSCLCFAQEIAKKPPSPSSYAQKSETESQTLNSAQVLNPSVALPPIFGPVQKIELSTEANSWAVQIISRGGFSGTGRGDLTITSQGNLVWNGAGDQCNAKLGNDALQMLAQTVFSASASGWGASRAHFCADCYVFAMVLQRREGDGIERTYIANWDEITAGRISGELKAVYDTFMAHKGCK